MRSYSCLLLLLCSSLVLQGCTRKSVNQGGTNSTYLDLRKSHTTVLTHRGPAPQEWEDVSVPEGITQVLYPSGSLTLKAWLAKPRNAQSTAPAVVYFHGGFAFGTEEFSDCQPFLDAGFVVMIPTFRGENGNPGTFELLYGEVEDAQEAVLWLASQPDINKNRIYTFGHSIGGGISALLSLWDDIPVRIGGSSGGLYPKDVFYGWKDFVPFDLNSEKETSLRLLIGNIRFMKRRHIAYLGREDSLANVIPAAEAEIKQSGAPLTIKTVAGDHFSSLEPAVSSFTEIMKSDK